MNLQQSDIILLLTAAIGAGLTGVVAIGLERTKKPHARAMYLLALLAIATSACLLVAESGLRINFTASEPRGIYQLLPLQRVQRGMLVAACVPRAAQALGQARGYLGRGDCNGAEPLLKTVAAIPGDNIRIEDDGVHVNGILLPRSAPRSTDNSGRTLTGWKPRRLHLSSDSVWLYANEPRSWDSRYWGPIKSSEIIAVVKSILTERP